MNQVTSHDIELFQHRIITKVSLLINIGTFDSSKLFHKIDILAKELRNPDYQIDMNKI